MEGRTLTALLKKAASDFPDRTAVSSSGKFALTHGRLQELVDHAAALLAGSGVGAGDVVALTFPSTVEFVILFLAVIRRRATVAPLDPAYTAEEFEVCLSDSESKLLLTPQEGNQPAQSAASKLNIPHLTAKLHSADSKITLSSTDIEPDLDLMSKVVNDPLDVALFLRDSGFSFLPKGMRLTQLDLASMVQFFKWDCELTESTSTTIASPLFHPKGLVAGLLSNLAAGAAVALQAAMGSASFSASTYCPDMILGKGVFGNAYEGYIGDAGTQVAVKIIKSESDHVIKEYMAEVTTLRQLRHKNVVHLLGYSHKANKSVLVYEFMREGSLEHHLFKGRSLLTWERRYNIARGLASGLHYLHEECDQCVIHRNIKSSNITLDENLNAKLGDFRLASLVDHASGPRMTKRIGGRGYAASKYCETGKASKEIDVYSFGVVLLEIGSGRRGNEGLVQWVWKIYGRGKLLDAVDSRLGKNFDKKQAKALMIAGLWCAHPTARYRPMIEEAMAVLNLEAVPPKLPLKMPKSLHIIEPKVSFGCFGR